jgi:phosphonate transport system substrate-binding protein
MIRVRSIVGFSCIWAITLTLLLACGRQDETGYQPEYTAKHDDQVKEYVVGVHPLHNPKRLMEIYGAFIEHANMQIPDARFRLEASRNYEEFDKKLYAGYYDLAMPNPYQTVRALKHGYRVFAKMGDDAEFFGIILVRKDGNIREVADLKGKVVAYPARSALAATMLPQYFLHTHGIDINFDIENRYVGSQESSILNVLRGHSAAGATWSLPWRMFSAEHPEMADQLEVKWQTAPLLNNSWVARRDVPRTIVDKFKTQLLSLDKTPKGRLILAKLPISKFETASNETYLPVIRFLEIFSSNVREIEW